MSSFHIAFVFNNNKKNYWGEFAGYFFGISDIACIFS
jgi:hypothetical protein